MSTKNIIATLNRTESRISKVLELDEFKMSRGARTRLEAARKDIAEMLVYETAKAKTPVGLSRLEVYINTETAEALKDLRLRQKGKNGSPITFGEAVRRCIALTKWIIDERDKGRMIYSQSSEGTQKQELVVL